MDRGSFPLLFRSLRPILLSLSLGFLSPGGFAAPLAAGAATLPAPTLGAPVAAGLTDREVPPQPLPSRPEPAAGAPNVVVVLLDDVGFGAAGTFGGPVPTPALDQLAAAGLRYNRFHTTAICSPTRASLLTGRNPHAIGIGNVMNTTAPYPGRNGILPASAATVAEVLRHSGYATSAWGKWHLIPHAEESPAGPFDHWPTRMGFDKFYGFLDGETHQYEPTLFDGTTPTVRPRRDHYHLTEDLADHAIAWMWQRRNLAPEKPFFVYFAPGATHAPLHAPREWIDRFHGKFDQGWDKVREETIVRQKQRGVIPADTALTPRSPELPAWESLSPERQRIAARLMETYAGFLAHTDAQVGRLAAALQEMGQFDNTLFIYIVGDNGASAEGGVFGTLNVMGNLQGVSESVEQALARYDEIGGTKSYPHYPAGWAWAMNTPFQWTKQVASHLGGTRNPMVVTWPRRILDAGGLRSQFSYVSDITPTILEAAGVSAPAAVNGVAQQPMDGASLVYSFDDAKAPTRHSTQYFEIFGNRGIYHQGWMASAFHGRTPWALIDAKPRTFDEDRWELYHLDEDFSQAHDLAAAEPGKLQALQALFWAEAGRNQVLPLINDADVPESKTFGNRRHFVFRAGAEGIAENAMPRLAGRTYHLSADLTLPSGGGQGVVAALGGAIGGWSLYLDAQGLPNYVYNLFGVERLVLRGKSPLTAGPAKLGLDFVSSGGHGKGAIVSLRVNGEVVDQGRLSRTAPIMFSIDEAFDVGTDSGSPVGDYSANYAFTGQLGQVVLDLE